MAKTPELPAGFNPEHLRLTGDQVRVIGQELFGRTDPGLPHELKGSLRAQVIEAFDSFVKRDPKQN